MKKMIVIICAFLIYSCAHQQNGEDRGVAQEKVGSEQSGQNFNLYETQWQTLKDIPTYDQSGFPACYSFAGAQFTEYFLRKNQMMVEDTEHLSPVWMALNYKKNGGGLVGTMLKTFQPNTLGYGKTKKAIKTLSEEGICKASIIRDNLIKISNNSKLPDADIVTLIELVFEYRDSPTAASVYSKIENSWQMQRFMKSIRNTTIPPSERVTKNELQATIQNIYEYLKRQQIPDNKSAYFSFFEKEITAGCEIAGNTNKYLLPSVRSVGKRYSSNKGINKKIMRGFKKTNFEYPVVIGYCSNVFKNQDDTHRVAERSLMPRMVQRSLQPTKKCSAHYSLVVGKRFDATKNSHDLLIRNSYGNEYMPVSNGCLCRNSQTQQFESCRPTAENPLFPPAHLKVLGCWLDENKVAPTVYDVISFKLDDQYLSDESDPQFEVEH